MITNADVGQNIQEARYQARMSQADLANLLSMHRSALSRMEAGVRAVTAVELVQIANILDIEVSELLSPRSRVAAHIKRGRLLLRASHVTNQDHKQLSWASTLWGIVSTRLPPGRRVGPVRRPRFLTSAQNAELHADLAREAIGLGPDDPASSLSAIAMDLGVVVVVGRMPSGSRVAGCSVMDNGRPSVVLVNSNHPPARQRFTLAHEIGHHILHGNSGAIACRSYDVRQGRRPSSEFEADVFASALLLPRRALRNLRPNQILAPDSLEKIEARFGTSRTATVARLRGLRLISDFDARALRRFVRKAQVAEGQPDFRRVGRTLAQLVADFGSENLIDGPGTRVVDDSEVLP